jgi:hypothetical protein
MSDWEVLRKSWHWILLGAVIGGLPGTICLIVGWLA